MTKVLRKKFLASFAATISVDVQKRLTDGEAKKIMKWLQEKLEIADGAYDTGPVKLVWPCNSDEEMRVFELKHPGKTPPKPIRIRVVEYFN